MAASTRIAYGPTSLGGQHLAAAARYIILAQQEIERAKAIADAITGGGVTPANLTASSDFGTVSDGAGLYTAIGNLNTNLATVTTAQLAALDQG
jgi:hypothetical protein